MKKLNQCFLWSFLLTTFLIGCTKSQTPGEVVEESFPAFYKEGHRGARGLMPENTIPAMKKALDVGANVLELDVHISKDNKVVVAHDPYMNRKFTLLPSGEEIPEEDARKYILYQMDYDEIRKFDVGSKYYDTYPEQKKMPAYIPLLGELIDSIEQYTDEKGMPAAIYNIEVKAKPEKDGVYQPKPEELIKLVMDVVNEKQIGNRFYIQSFDIRQIQEVRQNYPHVVTGFLTSNREASMEENLESIGFQPEIYSPYHKLATAELIAKVHERGMKFIPWTVNNQEDMERLMQMGVDGIITDYPNLVNELE
jgi:glycerophosphoryl diester phosphodiesterase